MLFINHHIHIMNCSQKLVLMTLITLSSYLLLFLKKFLRPVQTFLDVALRIAHISPVHSNAVINYAIAIYAYSEQSVLMIVSKTFPATINKLEGTLKALRNCNCSQFSDIWNCYFRKY